MAIPDFQTLMLPVLKALENGKSRRMRDITADLADQFGLTDSERAELIPSGRQATFTNRVAWARSYLVKAHLLEAPARGTVRITDRGKQVLANRPPRIDIRFLSRFPEFQEFRASTRPPRKESVEETLNGATPEEEIESIWRTLRDELAEELLTQVKNVPPSFFERLVVDLLVAMGYGGSRIEAAESVGRSGDGGIDGIIKEDKLGLDAVYVQAKRWDGAVGRPTVQGFAGSLEGVRARKGVLITTSSFTREAYTYVEHIEKRIVLIDGPQLVRLMIDHHVGVSTVRIYDVKRVDTDYFEVQ